MVTGQRLDVALRARLVEQADDPRNDGAYAHDAEHLGDCGNDEEHGGFSFLWI